MHTTIDPSILYFGTPVVVISTLNEDGSVNIAPMSSVWWLGSYAMLGLDGTSKTTENLQRTGECVLNLASDSNAEQVDKLALATGSERVPFHKQHLGYSRVKDKLGAAGLSTMPSELIQTPRVAQFPIQLEARVVKLDKFGKAYKPLNLCAYAVEIEILRVHIQGYLAVDGHPNRINPHSWKPLIMNFRKFFGLGEEIRHSRLSEKPEEMYTPWKQQTTPVKDVPRGEFSET